MKDYIQIGIEKGLITLNEDRSRITYVYQKKEQNFNNPGGEGAGRDVSAADSGLSLSREPN